MSNILFFSGCDCLPSLVMDKKFIRMPLEAKVIDSDEEWSQCGKWIISTEGYSVQDELWKDLQCLLKDERCIMIKASTAKMKDVGWIILCYTLPEKSRIKLAADSIRNINRDNKVMFYKSNAVTESGHYKSYRNMYTPLGRFYEKDRLNRWILVDDIYGDENRGSVSIGIEKVTNSQTLLDCFTMICDSITKNKEGYTEFETVKEPMEKLQEQGIFHEVTYNNFGRECVKITCFRSDLSNAKVRAETINVIRKHIIYPYPLHFWKYKAETKDFENNYLQTAEGEILKIWNVNQV